ncbi:hypothetical protein BJX96DRAFT_151382 [Aspergillus floccosus]
MRFVLLMRRASTSPSPPCHFGFNLLPNRSHELNSLVADRIATNNGIYRRKTPASQETFYTLERGHPQPEQHQPLQVFAPHEKDQHNQVLILHVDRRRRRRHIRSEARQQTIQKKAPPGRRSRYRPITETFKTVRRSSGHHGIKFSGWKGVSVVAAYVPGWRIGPGR